MARRKHTHKYHRIEIPYLGKIWACALPDCSHYMPKHLESTVIGKRSFCWACDKELILDEKCMEDDKPVHRACNENKPDATSILESLGVK